MFAIGNDGEDDDDCNAAGVVSSIYTIGITAMEANGSRTFYAEECTCIMAATYGGQDDYLMVNSIYFYKYLHFFSSGERIIF